MSPSHSKIPPVQNLEKANNLLSQPSNLKQISPSEMLGYFQDEEHKSEPKVITEVGFQEVLHNVIGEGGALAKMDDMQNPTS